MLFYQPPGICLPSMKYSTKLLKLPDENKYGVKVTFVKEGSDKESGNSDMEGLDGEITGMVGASVH